MRFLLILLLQTKGARPRETGSELFVKTKRLLREKKDKDEIEIKWPGLGKTRQRTKHESGAYRIIGEGVRFPESTTLNE